MKQLFYLFVLFKLNMCHFDDIALFKKTIKLSRQALETTAELYFQNTCVLCEEISTLKLDFKVTFMSSTHLRTHFG